MPPSDGIPSSPPGPSTSSADAIAYYKAQYESLEAELAEFQTSSKELEAELEKDIEASEKRERQLKEKAGNLGYEVDEWKTKYKQSKTEANTAQNVLQKEVTSLRDTNRTLQMRLRDTEVANDDFERQQRNTESSLEDLESKYSMAIERSVMMEEEIKIGEQEREALRIETQRLRDELSDLRIEADIIKEKWSKTEGNMNGENKLSLLESVPPSASPRSELSPTTSDSTPSFETPPGKTTTSSSGSGVSDTHTPPSPPTSEKSTNAPKPFKTPILPKTRTSLISNDTTPRPSTYSSRPSNHSRGPSTRGPGGRSTPSTNYRQNLLRPSTLTQRGGGLPQSNSIYHLHNLQGKMQRLTERVHTAKSKLPGPVNTPPKSSPRTNATTVVGTNIPATVTVRSSRKRATDSSRINGGESLPDQPNSETGISTPSLRTRASRQSLSMGPPTATPTRTNPSPDRSVLSSLARPSSRVGTNSNPTPVLSSNRDPNLAHSQQYQHVYHSSHTPSRPGSRTSVSSNNNHNARLPLSHRFSQSHLHQQSHFTPNASTDRIRPKSSLSNYNLDGAMDMEDEAEIRVDDERISSLSLAHPAAGDESLTSATVHSSRPSVLGMSGRRSSSRAMRVSDMGHGGSGGGSVRGISAATTPKTTAQQSKATTNRISISRLPAPTGGAGGRHSIVGLGLGFSASGDTDPRSTRPGSRENANGNEDGIESRGQSGHDPASRPTSGHGGSSSSSIIGVGISPVRNVKVKPRASTLVPATDPPLGVAGQRGGGVDGEDVDVGVGVDDGEDEMF